MGMIPLLIEEDIIVGICYPSCRMGYQNNVLNDTSNSKSGDDVFYNSPLDQASEFTQDFKTSKQLLAEPDKNELI